MEKCLFLYNPYSGKGKIVEKEEYITSRLREKYEVEVFQSKYAGNIGNEIKKRGAEFDLVVVAGGDGTLNEAVDAIVILDKKPKLGYIPTGTVNDLAHSLYIPRNIKSALKNILQGKTFVHDVMKINKRYGIYVCCAGLFTESSYATKHQKKKKMGKLAYFFHGIKKLFSTKAIHAKLCYDDKELKGTYAMALVPNSRYVAGFRINKRAVLNDGTVDVVLVESKRDVVNLSSILRVALMFGFGLPKKSGKFFHILKLNKFTLEMEEEHAINLDGEKVGRGTFNFEVIPRGVELIVPKPEKLLKYVKNQ